jgi:hypothetical protein
MTNMVCVCDLAAFELSANVRSFTQYKLVSYIREGSVMSGFCNYENTANVISYGNNIL